MTDGYGNLTPPPSWLSPDRPQPAEVDRTPPRIERLRHSWVTADEHGRMPALLLEWRETPDGWQGRGSWPWPDVNGGRWRPRED